MIQVVFQNHNFVVCNKPAQVLSVPAREKADIRACLGLELQKKLKVQVFPVHRLDYEVSGLILYALNSKAHQIAQEWFQKKLIQKTYIAKTPLQDFSHWPENIKTDKSKITPEVGLSFFWNTQILRGKKRSYESTHGEWAETIANIYASNDKSIIWHLKPVTGKAHQLRLELSRHGFPIDGDGLYGSKVQLNEPGIALKAVKIELNEIEDTLGLPSVLNLPSDSCI